MLIPRAEFTGKLLYSPATKSYVKTSKKYYKYISYLFSCIITVIFIIIIIIIYNRIYFINITCNNKICIESDK
jgi:hypothetical protein